MKMSGYIKLLANDAKLKLQITDDGSALSYACIWGHSFHSVSLFFNQTDDIFSLF